MIVHQVQTGDMVTLETTLPGATRTLVITVARRHPVTGWVSDGGVTQEIRGGRRCL
jgi:hypothetical protein